MFPIRIVRTSRSGQGEERRERVGFKRLDIGQPGAEQRGHGYRRAVSQPDPDDLRRVAKEECPLLKVGVLGHDHKSVRDRVRLHGGVGCGGQAHVADMGRPGKLGGQLRHQPVGQVLVEQELHAAGIAQSRRSRSAAKARQA